MIDCLADLFVRRGTSAYLRSIGKLRDELLDGEIFYTLKEAQVLIER